MTSPAEPFYYMKQGKASGSAAPTDHDPGRQTDTASFSGRGQSVPKKKSRRYRYTDDYRTVSYVDEKGKKRHDFIYTGKWFCVLNDAEEYRRIVWTVRAASFFSLAAAIAAMMILPGPANDKWFLVALAVSLFPLSYMVMGAVMLPGDLQPMESARYHRGVLRVRQSASFSLAVFAAAAAGLLVYWILAVAGRYDNAAPFSFRDAVFAVCLILAAGSCFLIRGRMKRIRIEERENCEVSAHKEAEEED